MQALKFSLEFGINSDVLEGDYEMIIHALVDDNDFLKNLNPFGHLIKDAKFLVGDSRSIGFLQVCCCRELIRNFQSVRKKKKKRESICPPKKKKIICIRQYLRGSAICLCSWSCRDFIIIREIYKVW